MNCAGTMAVDMLQSENSYGVRKRFEYISEVIARHGMRRVLDVGCGTGSLLTFPLAARFPDVAFLGVDVHRPSIEFARVHHRLPNLVFAEANEAPDGTFDLIIASEVMEHVERPVEFLLSLRNRLSQHGKIVLTVPNGFGPFEIMSLVEDILHLSGLYQLMKRLKRKMAIATSDEAALGKDTLAVDPHVNFFSFREVQRLTAQVGLRVMEYRPRTFLCGFALDHLLRGQALLGWNARVADVLPRFLSSAWMFLVETGSAPAPGAYVRNGYARLHRHLNLRRWHRVGQG